MSEWIFWGAHISFCRIPLHSTDACRVVVTNFANAKKLIIVAKISNAWLNHHEYHYKVICIGDVYSIEIDHAGHPFIGWPSLRPISSFHFNHSGHRIANAEILVYSIFFFWSRYLNSKLANDNQKIAKPCCIWKSNKERVSQCFLSSSISMATVRAL